MDETLLNQVLGEELHCPDCATSTVFWPVEGDDWVCTGCDGALTVPLSAA